MKFRSGLTPVTKNIRNIRFGREYILFSIQTIFYRPNEDSTEVHNVEKILKDIIDVRYFKFAFKIILVWICR